MLDFKKKMTEANFLPLFKDLCLNKKFIKQKSRRTYAEFNIKKINKINIQNKNYI